MIKSMPKCAKCDGSANAVCTRNDCPQAPVSRALEKSAERDLFLAQFDRHYAVQRIARAVHFERHHTGMRTNGPSTVELPTDLVEYLLSRWRREP